MPIPHGNITQSNIWTGQPLDEGEKNYRVTFTHKSRKVTEVTATSQEQAIEMAKARVATTSVDYDELISEYDMQIEEL